MRSKKIKTKGIVKKLILLNCSLILAPEKNPRGWKEPNQRIQKDNEKDLKKIKNDKEDLNKEFSTGEESKRLNRTKESRADNEKDLKKIKNDKEDLKEIKTESCN